MRPAAARVVGVISLLLALAPVARAATPPAPYRDPPFANACVTRHFDEGVAPPITGYDDEPLCVEYEKRDITLSNGGAIAFLAAEPARFAIAGPACKYWQRDHWRAQVQPGDTAIFTWDGSYWWDKSSGTGGAIMRNFRLNDVPMGPTQAAAYFEPYSPEFAAAMREYGDDNGGGGMSFDMGGGMPCGA